jgi:hypothetical protein
MNLKKLFIFFMTFVFMAASLAGGAAADDKGKHKARKKDKGAQMLPEVIVTGIVHQPQAAYVLPRAEPVVEGKTASPDNLEKVISSAEDSVF